MTALLLAGCGRAGEAERFEAWQERLSAASEIAFTGEITVSHERETAVYTADGVYKDGETSVTVRLPETISGVTFRSGGAGRSMSCEGVTVSLAPEREGELPAARAGELLLRTLTEGRILFAGQAGDTLTARVEGPEGLTAELWRTAEDVPVYAQLRRGEAAELILRISDWRTIEE